MAKHVFEFGEKEKHVITVSWSIFSKHLVVDLDGEKIANKMHLSPEPEKFNLDVGESEKHHVEVSIGGMSHTKIFLDGKEVELS